jgi:plasmid stability protein
VRLPRGLIEQMRVIANAHERSLSAELRVALREYVDGNAEATRSKQPTRA